MSEKSKSELQTEINRTIRALLSRVDPVDFAAYLGVAAIGYDVFKDWKGAVFGMVSLKLATSAGGMPPVAQVSGLAGLAALGLAEFVGLPELVEIAEETVRPIMPGGYVPTEIYEWKEVAEQCGRELYPEDMWGKVRTYLYGYRGRSLDQIADMLGRNGFYAVVQCANTKTGLLVGGSWSVCECDVNKDGVVNIEDIAIMARAKDVLKAAYCSTHHLGKTCAEEE